jgi:hypothetical protein
MDWIKYPDQKPDCHCNCYVMNEKAGSTCYVATYVQKYDYFSWNNTELCQNIPLEVTHYVILPVAI